MANRIWRFAASSRRIRVATCSVSALRGHLGEDPARIHQPVWSVIGNLGDSQCYLGVIAKVVAVQAALSGRIRSHDLPVRLIAPAYTLGVSDGQLNGTDRMRYSLIGPRAGERLPRLASARQRGRRAHRGRRVRQASGRNAGGGARTQRTGGAVLGRIDPVRHRPRHRRAHRPDRRIPARWRPRRREPHRVVLDAGARSGQLRRHVHVQHDANVHRSARHGTAPHGVARGRRSPPAGRVSGTARGLPGQGDERAGIRPLGHRDAVVVAQCPDGRYRHGRIHECRVARRRDRTGGRHRPLARRDRPR